MKTENNFDGIRLLLAVIVVFVHTATLTGAPEFRFWRPLLSSDFAVKGFFAISGFLVTKSYLTSNSLTEYFEKRIRRIFPAYCVIVVCCFLLGALVTKLGLMDYLSSTKTWKYLISNLVFANFLQPTLPGVFEDNREPFLNGALWTIKVEVCLYFVLPGILLAFRSFKPLYVTVVAYLLSVAWYLAMQKMIPQGGYYKELSVQFPTQLSYFVVGAYLAYAKPSALSLRLLALFSAFAFVIGTYLGFRPVVEPLFYGAFTLFLATGLPWKLYSGKYGDFSYGVYLVHFPIIQTLIYLGAFSHSPFFGLAITLPLVALAAVLMWHFVEKGFLKRTTLELHSPYAKPVG